MHSTAPAVRRSKSSFALRAVVVVLVLLLVAFLAFDVWFYRAVRSSQAQRDGNVRVAGLSAPVSIAFDSLGVPNISAANLHDVFFAQGYITAQDRLWQMDMLRRYTSGELAEVLGAQYVKDDRENRILGLRDAADHGVATMDSATRAQFEAYAAGVNAYIEQHRQSLPLEFRFLRYSPQPWTVRDSLLCGLAMTKFLSHGSYLHKLQKEKILARLGPELTQDLYVSTSWRDHPPGSEGISIENEPPDETTPDDEEEPKSLLRSPPGKIIGTQISQLLRQGISDQPTRAGSNNWVISGIHTATGKPLLANDMHLDLEIPNAWYEAHLTAGDFDVAGLTLPGLPYVVVGHNRRVAWGLTNLGPNVEDVYVEKFNDRGEYQTPQGWLAPQHREEIIRVKGKPDMKLDVVITRHGPIITDLIEGEQRKLALKWVVYDPQALRIPLFAVDSAQNWQEFEAAFAQFPAPSVNVVYADVEGHIGYQATGLIPLRTVGSNDLPVPGDDDAHEWTGYVPYDQLPRVYDPPSGIIATANGRIAPDKYPVALGDEWMSPYRTQRIYRLLGEAKKFTAADMLTIQNDIVSPFDRFCAERFVYAFDHNSKATERARQAAELMRNWDGTMGTDSAAATIAFYSRIALMKMLLNAKLGDEGRKQYRWFMQTVWLENVLTHQPPRWLPTGFEDYDQLLAAAVEAAVNDKDATHALPLWKWGRVYRVNVEHPFWSHFPILKKGAGPGSQPLSGDMETIKQVAPRFGPSERMTVDFADLDASTLDIVNGESGNIFDPHYNDQWDAYYHGRTFPLPFSAQAVEHEAAHHLTLAPQ